MILISGTIRNAVNFSVMNQQWEQKKADGNVLSKSERNAREKWTQEDYLKNSFEEQIAQQKENEKDQELLNKIASGKELTPEEIQYLERENPTALRYYREAKAEEAAYKESLKKCKTKDEAEQLKLRKLSQYAAQAKKVANNPNIPKSVKTGILQGMMGKTAHIEKAHQKFVQSAAYQKLPTEEEERERRKRQEEQSERKDAASPSLPDETPQETGVQKPQTPETESLGKKYSKEERDFPKEPVLKGNTAEEEKKTPEIDLYV